MLILRLPISFSLIFFFVCLAVPSTAKRPNIIILLTDDMNMNMINAYGNDQIQTPNMNRLVREGSSFMNAYNMGAWGPAVCIPSRSMLNTGLTLWNTQSNEYKWKKPLFSQLMSQAGYETYFTGKWHCHAGPKVDTVFNHVGLKTAGQLPTIKVQSKYSPWDKERGGFWSEHGHITELTTDDVINFIEAGSKQPNPFFLYAGFNAPHVPRQAAKKYFDMYPQEDIQLPPNLPEKSEDIEMKWAKRVTPKLARSRYQENYAVMTHFDENLGRILTALDSNPVANNTIIILMSDHGINLGENGVTGKECLYDLSMQGPLILRGPGVPAGKRFESLVYLQDIMPTLLSLASADIPEHVEFKNLAPIINGESTAVRDTIYGAFEKKMRCVVFNEHKLIRYYKQEGKVDRLFDLKNDPAEAHDQAQNPAYQGTLRTLQQHLIDEARRHNDPKKDI